MPSNYGHGANVLYNVDLVFCIDATGSMQMEHLLEMVKEKALSFYHDLTDCMESLDNPKHVNQLRIRLIAFRDYLADGMDAMLTTNFFILPQERELFEEAVQGITAQGGGDDPEDGLEALAYAIRSNWCEGGRQADGTTVKRRQVIVLWTDEEAHDLGFGKKADNYPREYMAKDFAELTSWWGDDDEPGYMDPNFKRLLLYAPATKNWKMISDNWDNVLHFQSEAGAGLDTITYDQILHVIAGSI